MKSNKLIKTIALLFIVLVSFSTLVFAQDYSIQEDQYEAQIDALKLQLHQLKGAEERDEEQIDTLKDLIKQKKQELKDFVDSHEDPNYNIEVFVSQESFLMQSTGPLQDLIDAASDGDTINLDSITYTGCVQVSKSLNFVGIGSTIINGGFNLTGNKDYSFSNLEINGACVEQELMGTVVYDGKIAIIANNVNKITLDNVNLITQGFNGGSGCPGTNGGPAYNIKSNSLAALEIKDSTLQATGGTGGIGNSGSNCHGGYGAKAFNINGVDTNNVEIRNSIFTAKGGDGGNGGPASSSKDSNDGGNGRKGRESYNILQSGTGLKVYDSEFSSTGGFGGNGGSANNRDEGGDGGNGEEAFNIDTNANHSIISGNKFTLRGGDAGLSTPGDDGAGGDGGYGQGGVSLKYGGVDDFVVDNNIFIARSGDGTSGSSSGSERDECNDGGDGGSSEDLTVIQGSGTNIIVSNNDITASMGNAGHGGCGDCTGDDDGGDGGDGEDVDDLVGIYSSGLIKNNILHDFTQGTAGNGGCADDGHGGDGGDVDEITAIKGGTEVIGNKIFNFKGGRAGNGARANSFTGCSSEYGGDGGDIGEIHIIEGGSLIEGNHIENVTHGTPGNGERGECRTGEGGHGGALDEIIAIDVGSAIVRDNKIINIFGTQGGTGGNSDDHKTGYGGDVDEVLGIEGGSIVEGNYIYNLKGNDGGCPGQSGDSYGLRRSGEDMWGIDNYGSRNNTIIKLTYGKRCTSSRGTNPEYYEDGRTICYDGNSENNYCDEIIGGTYNTWWGADYRKNITAVTPEIKDTEAVNNFEIEWYIGSDTEENFEIFYQEWGVANRTIANVKKSDVCSNVRCSYTWNPIMIPEHTFIFVRNADSPTDFDQSNYAINRLLEDGENCTLDEECLGTYCIHGVCNSERIGVKKPKAYTSEIFTWDYYDYFTGPETVDFTEQLVQALANCNATEEENCTIPLSFTAESEGILNISNLRVIYEQSECKVDADCEPTYCDSNDGCHAGTYRDYSDVLNTCENEFSCTDNACTAYTEIITDLDGDGHDIECDNDLDDSDPTVYSGAPELCDGKDNNQDGQIDETFTSLLGTSCTSGLGECEVPGTYVCAADFSVAVCNATPKPSTTEICDDKDNDCDGQIDNDVVETCGDSVCQGTKSCSYGVWSVCSTYEQDAGTCAVCDGYGNITYDSTQKNDCGDNNIALIDECSFNPDGVFGTYDYYIGFESTCAGVNTCSQDIGWQDQVSHTCDKNKCGAECELDTDCDDNNPSTSNMCDGSCACYYYEVIGISGLPDKSIDEEYTPPKQWINLMDYARYDVNDGYGLKFRITGQTNSGLISCYLADLVYIECESPAANAHGSTTITVRAYDGDYRDEDSFTITVNSVNDAPFLDTITTTLIVNEGDLVKINPQVTDADGDTLTYTFESPLNSSGEWQTGFGDAGTHYVQLTVSDGTSSASETYEIIVNNVNHAPSLTEITEDYSLYQDQTLTFTLTAEDIDVPYDTLNFTSSEDLTLSKLNDKSAQVTWIPDGNDVGQHVIYFTVTDEESFSDSISVNIEVLDVNDAPSITGEPNSQVTLRVNLSKTFKANITDPDDTNLDVKWYYDNEVVAEQVHEFILTPAELGNKVLSVVAIDKENLTTTHSWILKVVDNYQLNTFDGSTTKDILSMDNEQASNVDNFVLEKSTIGKIDFTNSLDLTESIDFDSCVTINGNLVAVDSDCLPALSESQARITLENIAYQQTPNIYYNDGYTLNPSDITQACTTCTLVSHTPAPTTNGTVIFDVEHFSSFLVTYIIETQPITIASTESTSTSWFDLEINVEVDGKDYDDVWDGDDIEAQPGDTIEISFKVESLSSDIEFSAEAVLEDVAGKDLDEDVDFDVREGRSEKEQIEFEIPYNTEEDSYDLEIELDLEDEDGNTYSEKIDLEIEVDREKHSLKILDVSLDEAYLRCDTRANLEVRLINLGADKEEITLTALNEELGIDREKVFVADNDYNDIYKIKIPVSTSANAITGNYNVDVKAYYDGDRLSDSDSFNVLVKPCMEQRTQEQPLETQSVVQVPNNPLPQYIVGQTPQITIEPRPDMHLITLINFFVLLLLIVGYMLWYVLFKM